MKWTNFNFKYKKAEVKKSHRNRRTHQRRIKIEVVTTTCILRKLNVPIYSSFLTSSLRIRIWKLFVQICSSFFNILTIHDFSGLNINKKKIHLMTTWSAIFRPRKALQNHSIRIKLCIVLVNKIRRLLPMCVGRQNLAVLVFLAGSTSKICRSRRLRKGSVNAFHFCLDLQNFAVSTC